MTLLCLQDRFKLWLQTSSKLLLLLACPGSVLGWPHWVVCYSSICQFSHDWGLFLYPPPTHICTYISLSASGSRMHTCLVNASSGASADVPSVKASLAMPFSAHYPLLCASTFVQHTCIHLSIWHMMSLQAVSLLLPLHPQPLYQVSIISYGLSVSFDPFWLFSTPQPERAFSSESQEFLL